MRTGRWPQRRCSPSEPSPGIPCANRELLVAALGRFFTILMDVLNHALKDEQVGTALACELDAIAVIPLDRTAKDFATVQDDRHGSVGLHLLDPVEVLSVSGLRWRGFFAEDRTVVLRAGNARLLDVRETRTKHTTVHHDSS